jgi:hypothetical protein
MRHFRPLLPVLLLWASLAGAQSNPLDFSGVNTLGAGLGSIFDPSRFSMRQSFTMGYASSGKSSLLSNTYCNSMNYRISPKLEMKLDLAYSYLPAAFNRSSYRLNNSSQGVFLPSFGLKYQPSSSFTIQFEYNNPGNFGSRYLPGW